MNDHQEIWKSAGKGRIMLYTPSSFLANQDIELSRSREQAEKEATEALNARVAETSKRGWSEASALGAITLWIVWWMFIAT